jgi:hypothetical protein
LLAPGAQAAGAAMVRDAAFHYLGALHFMLVKDCYSISCMVLQKCERR